MSLFRRRQIQVSLSPETAAPLKTELAAKSTTYLNLSMPSWGTNTPSSGSLSPYWPAVYPGPCCLQLDRRAILSNIALRLEHQLTEIPSPPVAEEKHEHPGDGRELSENSIWARSCRRRIQPRVGLSMVKPVLSSPLLLGRRQAEIAGPLL